MRTCTISYAALDNYGAILQRYALLQTLEALGHPSQTFDYRIRRVLLMDRLRSLHLSYARHAPLGLFTSFGQLLRRWQNNELFRRNYIHRTRRLYSAGQLAHESARFEAIVSGSDEVFRLDARGRLIAEFLLGFADPLRQRLVAYGASAGETRNYGSESETATRLLRRFHHVSVRDVPTQQLVRSLIGIQAPIVQDPVLVCDFSQLPSLESPEPDCLLVYGYFNSPATDWAIRKLADQLGVRMVSVGWASKYAHRNLLDASPLEWMALIRKARLVLTNCYHGLVFSVLFQRDFLVFDSHSARLKVLDFLQRHALGSRLLEAGQMPSASQLEGVDYPALAPVLAEHRKESLSFLEQALGASAAPAGATLRAPA